MSDLIDDDAARRVVAAVLKVAVLDAQANKPYSADAARWLDALCAHSGVCDPSVCIENVGANDRSTDAMISRARQHLDEESTGTEDA